MEDGQYVIGSDWFYAPNKPAAIVFACFFLISGLVHFWQCYRYKSWRVSGLLPWSALLFVIGFTLRSYGAWHYDNLPIFIASTVFLYAAAPVYELSNYFVLSRLLHFIPHLSPLHPARVITTFAGISVIVEALTANGAAKAVNSSSTPHDVAIGQGLLKAALIMQIFVLALFVGVAGRFQWNCSRNGILEKSGNSRARITALLLTLYISSALIGTRTIYRTVEYFATASIHAPTAGEQYSPSDFSPIIRYEWFFYVFETTLMFTNSIMLNFRHPGKYLPRTITTYLGEDGIEREGCKFKDQRSTIVQILDPFDIIGLVKGNDKKDKWWEQGHEGSAVDVEGAPEAQTPKISKT